MDNLQQLLEIVETPGWSLRLCVCKLLELHFIAELLESVVKLLMTISKQHPHCLNQYFKVLVVEDRRLIITWHFIRTQLIYWWGGILTLVKKII